MLEKMKFWNFNEEEKCNKFSATQTPTKNAKKIIRNPNKNY
jgi:hypothetical protein